MIYAVNKRTKEHRVVLSNGSVCEKEWYKGRGWEIIKSDENGWIEWNGGECPLPESAPCNLIFSGAAEKNNISLLASFCYWSHRNNDNDIIAYRPILDQPARDEPKEWCGEGLPPMGTVCKWRANENEWKKGFIIATFSDRVWLTTGDGLKEQVWNVSVLEFRPIRTDREKWINQAADVALQTGDALGNVYDALKSGDLPQP